MTQSPKEAKLALLNGIVGTPDENGMITFKVHADVVAALRAEAPPSGLTREGIARIVCCSGGCILSNTGEGGMSECIALKPEYGNLRVADAILALQPLPKDEGDEIPPDAEHPVNYRKAFAKPVADPVGDGLRDLQSQSAMQTDRFGSAKPRRPVKS